MKTITTNGYTTKALFLLVLFLALCTNAHAQAQGGWYHVDDEENDIVRYTTQRPYVGAAFIDINNDHLPDLFAAPNTVFLNQGKGFFKLNVPTGFNSQAGVSGCSWADIDNDGDNDVVLASTPSRVFINDGTGKFSSITAAFSGLTSYGSFGCAIGDINGDANLEILFAHANGFHPPTQPTPCKLFVGSQSGFNPMLITGFPFTDSLGPYTNPYWSDYDMDGDMDLFIATGPAGKSGLDYCYKNMKKETGKDSLQRITEELFAQQVQDGQCYNFIDVDNDGDFDLCLTNYVGAPSRLYLNNNGIYALRQTPFSAAATNLANCWGDYDNDGDLDVIITNDNAPARYYRNDANAQFSYVSDGFTTATAICSVVNSDYDNDGDLDVFANGIGNNGSTESVGLYRNDSLAANRSWINLELSAKNTNRSALGTIVNIKAKIQGKATWQLREVNAQNSFQGQNDMRVHFGLDDALIVDSLIIIWASGTKEYYTNVPAKRFYQIREGENAINSVRDEAEKETLTIYPNPAHETIVLSIENDFPGTWMYQIVNATGRLIESGTIETGKQSINISSISAGCYGIIMSNTTQTRFGTFIRY